MKRTGGSESISKQVKAKVRSSGVKTRKLEYDGDIGQVLGTGSTLLDLAISGGRIRGGGIPTGIFVEIFGPSSSGKTVLLSEMAGRVQDTGGEVVFHDPEGRLNKQFARLFKFELDQAKYIRPDTVPEIFREVRNWKPKNPKLINAVFADSLAALSTDMEMGSDEGDLMGTRRAKEFSQELRRTCRILVEKNLLIICSNQIRENIGGGQFSERYKSTGGKAMEHYPSLRLRTQFAYRGAKMRKTVTHAGKDIKKSIGVNIEVEVYKSSVWKPHQTAPVTIIFDYGIDDIRQNLQYIKTYTKSSVYGVGSVSSKSINDAIAIIEEDELEDILKEEVINLWEEIEMKFHSERKTKKR